MIKASCGAILSLIFLFHFYICLALNIKLESVAKKFLQNYNGKLYQSYFVSPDTKDISGRHNGMLHYILTYEHNVSDKSISVMQRRY